MSFIRALRRCKTYELNASEFGSVLQCFDIPSRRNVVEPFVTDAHHQSPSCNGSGEPDHRLYRTALPEHAPSSSVLQVDEGLPFKSTPPRNTEPSPYHNLWNSPSTTTTKATPRQTIDDHSPLRQALPKLQAIQATAQPNRLLHSRLHDEPLPSVEPQDRDWNAEFQAILKQPVLARGTELKKLCDEFVSAAKALGETIIRERNLPTDEKTIKPLSGKGKAGGEKFKVGNIFFKFAVDQDGIYPSDHEAMKVAGHELKGLNALVSCGMMLGLNFPLLALIDYRGFRLIATSALPISEDTIVYGSCDGGNTVHTDVPEMNALMEKVFKILNLKGHWTGLGEQLKWIHGPCDIEGHGAKDGKFYVVDTARVWPCETPDKRLKGGFLYRLLRPELVKNLPFALSSDAFTYFGHHDAEIHNAEVEEATQHLFETVIPEFALSLEGRSLTGFDLVEELHRAGINCRHLGSVRESVVSGEVRALILLEVIARTLKNKLRSDMRSAIGRDEDCYDRLAVGFFNFILGHQGEQSRSFWNGQLKSDILGHFTSALNEAERDATYELFRHVDPVALFKRLQALTGVTFRKGADPTRPLGLGDFVGIQVRAKHMYAIPRIEADTLAELARTKDAQKAIRLYTAARDLYRSVITLKPDDTTVLQNLGMVLADMAKLKLKISQDVSGCDRLFEMAYDKFECSLSIKSNDYNALIRWGNALCEQAASKAAMGDTVQANMLYSLAGEKYTKAHAIKGDDRDVMFNWGNQLRNRAKILVQRGELEEAETQLADAAQRYRTCMLLPRKGNDQLTLDTLINWGCGWLALARVRHALPRQLEDVSNCFDQARLQFMKAAALVKRGGLFESQPESAKKYLDLLSYNMRCLSIVHERCVQVTEDSNDSPVSPDIDFYECDDL